MTLRVVNLKDYPRNAVKYIGRGSAFGNPFTHLPLGSTKALVQCDSLEACLGCYEDWARGSRAYDKAIPRDVWRKLDAAMRSLRGDELLACYCQDPAKCHGMVIKKLWEELYS